MAAAGGREGAPVSEQLLTEPYKFDFFQAVRLMQQAARERLRASEEPARVGADFPPGQEPLRFRSLPSHTFAAGEISSIRSRRSAAAKDAGPAEDAHSPAEMIVTFFGLVGPCGVLPVHYTQLVLDRTRMKDFALRDFLDLFQHRAISHFYRAWEKYRFPYGYERAAFSPPGSPEDLFTQALFCLVGLGTPGLRGRLETPDQAYLRYGGQYAHGPRNAISLERIVADYFDLPVEVLQFHGQWLYLDDADQTSMPTQRAPEGLNCELGHSVVVGERVWGVEQKFRLRLGPLGYKRFRRFVPSGDLLAPLCQFVRMYVGAEFDFDVEVVLKRDEVPDCRLGAGGEDPSLLGWNTWVSSEPFLQDVSDGVFVHEGWPSG